MISAQNTLSGSPVGATAPKETIIFGVPIGKLGLFSRLGIAGACGFLIFFVTFFLSIIGVAIYDSVKGISLTNLNIAYLYIAAPVGILAMLASLIYLIGGWARRKFSSAE